MDKPTLCLGIPTINRKDLLDEALEVYRENWRKRHIFIVDNGNQQMPDNPPYLKVWTPPQNIGVAASWNKMIERAKILGYSHVMILNDDVVMQKDPFDIEKFIEIIAKSSSTFKNILQTIILEKYSHVEKLLNKIYSASLFEEKKVELNFVKAINKLGADFIYSEYGPKITLVDCNVIEIVLPDHLIGIYTKIRWDRNTERAMKNIKTNFRTVKAFKYQTK